MSSKTGSQEVEHNVSERLLTSMQALITRIDRSNDDTREILKLLNGPQGASGHEEVLVQIRSMLSEVHKKKRVQDIADHAEREAWERERQDLLATLGERDSELSRREQEFSERLAALEADRAALDAAVIEQAKEVEGALREAKDQKNQATIRMIAVTKAEGEAKEKIRAAANEVEGAKLICSNMLNEAKKRLEEIEQQAKENELLCHNKIAEALQRGNEEAQKIIDEANRKAIAITAEANNKLNSLSLTTVNEGAEPEKNNLLTKSIRSFLFRNSSAVIQNAPSGITASDFEKFVDQKIPMIRSSFGSRPGNLTKSKERR